MKIQIDCFGQEIINDPILRDKFIEPPFSVLDTKSGSWQRRKKIWKAIGIKSEIGRTGNGLMPENTAIGQDFDAYRHQKKFGKTFNMKDWTDSKLTDNRLPSDTSIFDPALCEVLYHWFCAEGGKILDPFAGGSVRGIVANYLGYKYTGIDIRQEQIDSNYEQSKVILSSCNQPVWIVGDSNIILDSIQELFDFVMSCPPYLDLEVYSDLPGDISNMSYDNFMIAYKTIIKKSCDKLKKDGYACFVVGEVRDKKGNYIGFVPDTIRAFQECGMKFYNEAILLNSIASASIRANGNMNNKKLVKVHQNVLVFKKY